MSVVSPIGPDPTGRAASNGELIGQRPAGRSGFRRPLARVVCAASLVTSDVYAWLLAVAVASLHTGPAGVRRILPGEQASAFDLLTTGVLFVGVLVSFARQGHYTRRVPFWTELQQVVFAALVAFLCNGFLRFALHDPASRLFLGLTWLTLPAFVMLARSATRSLLTWTGVWRLPVVLVGQGSQLRDAEAALRSEPRLGYTVVGLANPTEFDRSHAPHRWRALLEYHHAALLVLSLDLRDPAAEAIAESLVRARVPFAAMPRLAGLPVLGFEPTAFLSHDTIMLHYHNNLARPLARALKFAFDLGGAATLMLLAAPVLVIVTLLVRMDGGPALYAHRRVGANGREFKCLKFRSMVPDADTVLRRLLQTDPAAAAEWAETRKLRNDPRITRVGRFLRATSLDELPQLFNVLRLEMSLVGPRPIVQAEVSRYGEDICYYYETRPGLTGLWQVSGRSDTSYSHRVHLDTWYVKNWSVWHDVAILAKTVPAVLRRQGAL